MKAFIFDLNGTMIDDMQYHAEAWRDILTNHLKKLLTHTQVKEQMYWKNYEALARIFGNRYFESSQVKRFIN
jgi:beta-phosphoglucomutase